MVLLISLIIKRATKEVWWHGWIKGFVFCCHYVRITKSSKCEP